MNRKCENDVVSWDKVAQSSIEASALLTACCNLLKVQQSMGKRMQACSHQTGARASMFDMQYLHARIHHSCLRKSFAEILNKLLYYRHWPDSNTEQCSGGQRVGTIGEGHGRG